eukprot:9688300-Lingulodinium_polyedra.AAC.1
MAGAQLDGVPARKPTSLMATPAADLSRHIQRLPNGGRCHGAHRHAVTLGRTESGWRAAPLKQYPSGLCE